MAAIKGLQKTSLVDYPGIVACTIFISSCNFRCPFCQNPDLVNDSKELKEISELRIMEFLLSRKGKIDGVCITGGEPTLYLHLKRLIKGIKMLGLKVKIDTNGANPAILQDLLDSELIDFVAMDIKSDKENYSKASGVKVDISKIERSVSLIMESYVDYEFRSTVVPDFFNEKIVRNIGKWLNGATKFSLQKLWRDILTKLRLGTEITWCRQLL